MDLVRAVNKMVNDGGEANCVCVADALEFSRGMVNCDSLSIRLIHLNI